MRVLVCPYWWLLRLRDTACRSAIKNVFQEASTLITEGNHFFTASLQHQTRNSSRSYRSMWPSHTSDPRGDGKSREEERRDQNGVGIIGRAPLRADAIPFESIPTTNIQYPVFPSQEIPYYSQAQHYQMPSTGPSRMSAALSVAPPAPMMYQTHQQYQAYQARQYGSDGRSPPLQSMPPTMFRASSADYLGPTSAPIAPSWEQSSSRFRDSYPPSYGASPPGSYQSSPRHSRPPEPPLASAGKRYIHHYSPHMNIYP